MLISDFRNLRGLSVPNGPANGLDAEGNPVKAQFFVVNYDDLPDLQSASDTHMVAYRVVDPKDRATEIDPQCRLRKESLQPLRELGYDVVCDSVIIDLDLNHIDDLKEKYGKPNAAGKKEVGWVDLPPDVSTALMARFDIYPKIGPWSHAYSTEHGMRYVFILHREVPCGSNYEDLVMRVIESFWQIGLPADRACKDWSRLFRCPSVTKENGMSTWEQPWYFHESRPFKMDPPDDVMTPRDERRAGGVMRSQADRPDDDEAEAILYSAPGEKTEFGKALERKLRRSSIYSYVFGNTKYARDGSRHGKLTQLIGILVDEIRRIPGSTVEQVYGAAWQAIKLLDQDEDWRSKAWEMARSFWARDGGAAPAPTPETPAPSPSAAMLPAVFAEPAGEQVASEIMARLEAEGNEMLPKDEGELNVSKDGEPFAEPMNIRIAVRLIGARVEYDEFSDRMILHHVDDPKRKWRNFPQEINDQSLNAMRIAAHEELGLEVSKDDWWGVVENLALRRKRHPVREYLDSLKWDGVNRACEWLRTYLGAADDVYTRAVGTLFLVGAVRRIREPGCKFDELMLLEGAQGTQKSGALRVLAVRDDWFSDDLPLGVHSKEVLEQTLGKWIIEAADLQGMNRRTIDDLKAALSRQKDTARQAYGRLATTRKRQFIIAGTTNSDRYLKDITGNRRFWPVRTSTIDMDSLVRDRDQIWAEAALYEAEGSPSRLDPALYPLAAEAQEERRIEDPYKEILEEALGTLEGKLRCRDVWEIIGNVKERRSQDDNQRIGAAIRKIGWDRAKCRYQGSVVWCYVKGDRSVALEIKKVGDRTVKVKAVRDDG